MNRWPPLSRADIDRACALNGRCAVDWAVSWAAPDGRVVDEARTSSLPHAEDVAKALRVDGKRSVKVAAVFYDPELGVDLTRPEALAILFGPRP